MAALKNGMLRLALDGPGIGKVLREDCRSLVDSFAEDVADNVRGRLPSGTEVTVRTYTTDRASASVGIEDYRGMAWQARDGVLTRSADAAGLEVTRK